MDDGDARFRLTLVDRPIDGLAMDTLASSDRYIGPYSWSFDKRFLIYVSMNENSVRDLMYIDMSQAERTPMVLSNEPVHEMFADFHPDGKYFVYQTDEVFIQAFPPTGRRIKVSDDGGGEPFWANSGSEILYRTLPFNEMISVPVDLTEGIKLGSPKVLWAESYPDVPGRSYGVTPDGRLFLMKKSIESQHTRDRILVVEDWLQELEDAVH